VEALRKGKATYSAEKIRSLIDGFGTPLIEHLKEEVVTFEALEKLSIDWPAWDKKVKKMAVDNAETVTIPFLPLLQILTYIPGIRNSNRGSLSRLHFRGSLPRKVVATISLVCCSDVQMVVYAKAQGSVEVRML
jgi:hypothetical protein